VASLREFIQLLPEFDVSTPELCRVLEVPKLGISDTPRERNHMWKDWVTWLAI
jgi:hypothetical protein